MKNINEYNNLSISERAKESEMLGSKVAKIINRAMKACNLVLQPTGFGVNINVDFYKLPVEKTNQEVLSG